MGEEDCLIPRDASLDNTLPSTSSVKCPPCPQLIRSLRLQLQDDRGNQGQTFGRGDQQRTSCYACYLCFPLCRHDSRIRPTFERYRNPIRGKCHGSFRGTVLLLLD